MGYLQNDSHTYAPPSAAPSGQQQKNLSHTAERRQAIRRDATGKSWLCWRGASASRNRDEDGDRCVRENRMFAPKDRQKSSGEIFLLVAACYMASSREAHSSKQVASVCLCGVCSCDLVPPFPPRTHIMLSFSPSGILDPTR